MLFLTIMTKLLLVFLIALCYTFITTESQIQKVTEVGCVEVMKWFING